MFEGSAIAMPAMWSAPLPRSHANPLVTETEVTSATAANRPVRRVEARIVSIYRLWPWEKVIRPEHFAARDRGDHLPRGTMMANSSQYCEYEP